MDFREWLLTEGQWLSANHITSLGQSADSAFFLFDDKPVVAIDFRFELLGENQLNSISGARWICKIPEKVQYSNGELIYCSPLPQGGPYIVVNRFYQGPQHDPYVSLSKRPTETIKKQMELEIKQRAFRNQQRLKDELKRQITPEDKQRIYQQIDSNNEKSEIEQLEQGGYKGLYTKLPDNWLTYATITVKNAGSKSQVISCRECGGSGRIDNDTLDGEICDICRGAGKVNNPDVISFKATETIDLFERTRKKQVAMA